MKGRNDPTAFLSLSPKIGGQINSKPKDDQYLTEEQARAGHLQKDRIWWYN